MTDRKLLSLARAAARKAWAPYSRFQVGAALLCTDGTVVTGCNVENASYGLSICAERVAITKAVSDGRRGFQAIAVVALGRKGRKVRPCGACRQVMAEFGAKMRVVCEDLTTTVADLLPERFSFRR